MHAQIYEEMVLEDFCRAYGMHGIALRYFNPIGADPKLRSGAHVQFPSHVLAKLLEAHQVKTHYLISQVLTGQHVMDQESVTISMSGI